MADPDPRLVAAIAAILDAIPADRRTPENLAKVLTGVMKLSSRPLSTHIQPGRVMDVDQGVTPTRGSRISAAKTKQASRLHQLAQEAGLSLPGLHGALPPGTRPSLALMHSWLKKTGRPVPQFWAKYLARELKDPSLLLPESWPHGIS